MNEVPQNQQENSAYSPYTLNQDALSNSWPQLSLVTMYKNPQTLQSDQDFSSHIEDSFSVNYNEPNFMDQLKYLTTTTDSSGTTKPRMLHRNRPKKRRPRNLSRNRNRHRQIDSSSENYCLQQFLEQPIQKSLSSNHSEKIQSSGVDKEGEDQWQNCSEEEEEYKIDIEQPKFPVTVTTTINSNNTNNNNNTNDNSDDENSSSWCDLSDASVTSISILASGDADNAAQHQDGSQQSEKKIKIYEEKITNLRTRIHELQQQNEELTQHMEERLKCFESLQSSGSSYQSLPRELPPVKEGLVELTAEETSSFTDDWKKTWDILQARLNDTLHENSELRKIIRRLEKTLKDVEIRKAKEKSEFKKKINELHYKEVDMLKQLQDENLRNQKVVHKREIEKLEQEQRNNIEELKYAYETKITELKVEYEREMLEKNAEIYRLNTLTEKQCVKMSTEVCALKTQIEGTLELKDPKMDVRIIFLRKCISKMDKLFKKSEKDYTKQIEKLKRELESKEKSMRIQLRTQKAELLAVTSGEKQTYMDRMICELEGRYIQMLEEQAVMANQNKKKDEQIIADMKQLLDKHDIPYTI